MALRNFRKQGFYSAINIFGLAIGMACSILILLYARYEFSYDSFHLNGDRIYRIERKSEQRGAVRYVATTPVPLAPAMRRGLPDVENSVRLLPQQALVRYGDKAFEESKFFYVDSTFFSIFTFPLREGDTANALVNPNSVVISIEMARKYFGNTNPVGKTIMVEDSEAYEVTGVLESVPKNIHFSFDFLASFASLKIDETPAWRWLNQNIYYTYVLIHKGAGVRQIEQKVDNLYQQNVGEEMARLGWHLHNSLRPLTGIHLSSNTEYEIEPGSDASTVALLSTIGLLVLFVACFNFINLSTARSGRRANEIGLRKVFGAHRTRLIGQFLGESVLLTLLALVLAAGMIEFSIPILSTLVDFRVVIAHQSPLQLLLGFILFALMVGIIAGSYPAFFLASLRPVSSFRDSNRMGKKGVGLRQGLVVLQFAVSIILMIGTSIMYWQLEYVGKKNLGFHKEQVVVIPIRDQALQQNHESLKAELLRIEGVIGASAAYRMPGDILGTNTFRPEGVAEDARPSIRTLYVDHDFIQTLGLELAAGRGFSKDFTADATESFVVNEAAVQVLGWQDAVGKKLGWGNRDGKIIGVVNDFHFASLHENIAPLVLLIYPDMFQRLALRVRPQNLTATLARIRKMWQDFAPNRPFEYSFLDDDFDKLYKADQQLEQIWFIFAGLAILIACLGLFGLAAYSAERRTKEIGIRKVLGASISTIASNLSRDFIKLVLLANLIAWPLAYYTMRFWLQDFAYRIEMSWWIFAMASCVALFIALLTVSTQAIRAALANPVDSLRYE